MGNLKSTKTKEEWDELVDSTITKSNQEAAEKLYDDNLFGYEKYRAGFIEGAAWQKEKYTSEEQHIERSLGELEKSYIKGFNEGAAWKAERMYSDFDVMDALHSVELKDNKNYTKIYNGMKEWFDQNKKQKS
jgi:hypothetical protein